MKAHGCKATLSQGFRRVTITCATNTLSPQEAKAHAYTYSHPALQPQRQEKPSVRGSTDHIQPYVPAHEHGAHTTWHVVDALSLAADVAFDRGCGATGVWLGSSGAALRLRGEGWWNVGNSNIHWRRDSAGQALHLCRIAALSPFSFAPVCRVLEGAVPNALMCALRSLFRGNVIFGILPAPKACMCALMQKYARGCERDGGLCEGINVCKWLINGLEQALAGNERA
eukprot:18773-Pelagomonas_calceolata.AAC.4